MSGGHNTRAIGDVLRELRQQRGWSLRDVERRSGGALKSGHLSQIETGRVVEPSLSVIRTLAQVFGYTLKAFLGLISDDEDRRELSSEQNLLLTYFSDLPPTARDQALGYLRYMATENPARPGAGDGP